MGLGVAEQSWAVRPVKHDALDFLVFSRRARLHLSRLSVHVGPARAPTAEPDPA